MTDQSKAAKAKALLEGLSKGVEDLGRDLRRRRAGEKKARPKDPGSPPPSVAPAPPRPDVAELPPLLPDAPFLPASPIAPAASPPPTPPAAAPSPPTIQAQAGTPPGDIPPAAAGWLADLDLAVLAAPAGPTAMEPEEEDLKDQLDPEFSTTVQEETEELLPAIGACLEQAGRGDAGVVPELLRLVHTLKGVAGMAGAMKTRALIHRMETLMEQVSESQDLDLVLIERVGAMFAHVRRQLSTLFSAPPPQAGPSPGAAPGVPAAPVPAPKTVRIPADVIDRLFNEINEARLAGTSLAGSNVVMRRKLREMDENIGRVSRMARDLELQAETQIQSRRAQMAESSEDFDPLEMDRFTLLQELSRLLNEAVSDVQDLQHDVARAVSEQETHLAYQERSIHEVQEGMLKTRLVSVDAAINDRLHKIALSTAKELGKSVVFSLSGGRVALDRAMLEKIIPPLEHILRNAVAHGIETPQARVAAGKPASGQLQVAVRQEAGRVMFIVQDDGAGLDLARIRQRAVERGLWPSDQPMDERHAADMVCRPGFSTAEVISLISGRGVGMDVVRTDVLSMGGRFDMASQTGKGLRVALQLPTTVASAAVLVVDAEGETWSVPTEIVDDVMMARGALLEQARASGILAVDDLPLPFASLGALMGVSDPASVRGESAPVLLLREGDRRVAVEASKLREVVEVPLRPLARVWSGVPGIVGSTLLPDGRASFLVDPLRAPWAQVSHQPGDLPATPPAHRPPLVLVVDDSITVRKVTASFLERNGFEPILAKDGQEALEMLAQIQPAAMLLDVEMPRMDGFDCARNVRENPRHRHLPILMITSRTAQKHRDRALALGVDEYLGKPFREEELLALLHRHIHRRVAPPGLVAPATPEAS